MNIKKLASLPVLIIIIVSISAFLFGDAVDANQVETRRDAFFFTACTIAFLWLALNLSHVVLIKINSNNTSSSYPIAKIFQIVVGGLSVVFTFFGIGMFFRLGEQLINVYYIISLYGVGAAALVVSFSLLFFVYYKQITEPLINKWHDIVNKNKSNVSGYILLAIPLVSAMSLGSAIISIIIVIVIFVIVLFVVGNIMGYQHPRDH